MVAPFISMKETVTWRVGSIRVRPVRHHEGQEANSSAKPIANGASSLRRDDPLGSASDESNCTAEVSTLVIRQRQKVN